VICRIRNNRRIRSKPSSPCSAACCSTIAAGTIWPTSSSEGDFYRADHGLIYRAICDLIGANRPCDFVTLSEHLRAQNKLDASRRFVVSGHAGR
jgi:hypothetical protein